MEGGREGDREVTDTEVWRVCVRGGGGGEGGGEVTGTALSL